MRAIRRLLSRESVYLGVAAVLFVSAAYLTSPTMFDGVDFLHVHAFYKEYMARALRAARFPLWNPHINLGRPFHADSDSAIFYPPHLLYVVLDVRMAWALLAMGHVWLALIGAARFLRALGTGRILAWGLALGFVASAPMVEPFQNGLVHYAIGLCYLPWVLLLSLRLQDCPTWDTASKLALLVGMQYLGGHVQVTWLTLWGATLFVLGRGPGLRGGTRAILYDVARLTGCCAWGLALAAVQVLPMLELVEQGNRHASLAFTSSFSMPWYGWLSLLTPPGPQFPLEPQQANLFCGAFILVGGLCGLTQLRRRNVRGLLLLALVATLVGAGNVTPLFRWAHAWVPGFSSFRLHSRSLVLTILALVAAAGIFLSPSGEPNARGRLRVAIIGLLVLVATTILGLRLIPAPLTVSQGEAVVRSVVVAGACVLLLLLRPWAGRPWSRPRTLVAASLALLVAGDLALSVARIKVLRSRPFSDVAERAIDAILRQNGLYAAGVPPRISFPMDYVRPNAGMHFGFSTFAGYTSLTLDRTFAFMYGMQGLEEPLSNAFPASNIYDRGPFPYHSMNIVLGYDPAAHQAAMARRPDARVYLAFASEVVPNWRTAIEKMRRGHDFHRVVLLEAPLPLAIGDMPATAGAASLRHFEPERIAIDVDSPTPAWLVVAEAWYPGWAAKVNGQPAPCVPGNVWMRVVPVPAGKATVELAYVCTSLPAGAALSGLALMGILTAWFWTGRRCGSAADQGNQRPGPAEPSSATDALSRLEPGGDGMG